MADRSRLLLDTQVIVWWDAASSQLGDEARDLVRGASKVYVSAVSEWELTIKAALGKMVLHRRLLDATREAGFEALGITFEHVQTVGALPPIHRDPFDRLLVAVAQVEGLTILSSDPVLAEYGVTVVDARE